MRDMTIGKPSKQIISFTLPILWSFVLQQVYNMADAVVAGRFIGSRVLAAVGISGLLMNFLLAIIMGLATGTSILVSQLFGAKQEENLRRTVSTSLIFALVLVAVISGTGYAFTPGLLRLLDVPGDIIGDAATYLRIILMGMVFSMCASMFGANLTALGETKKPFYIMLACNTVNLGLDLLFVLAFGWGVAAIAATTVAAQALGAALGYIYIVKRVPILKITKLIFDRKILRSILKYSIPTALQTSIQSFGGLVIIRLVNGFGGFVVAGYTAAMKVDQFAVMPVTSMSAGITTFAAQNMGAGLEDHAKRGLRFGLFAMVAVALVLTVIIRVAGAGTVSLFIDSADGRTQILAAGTQYITINSGFYVLFAALVAFNGFFRGAGDALIVMIMTLSSLALRAGFAYALVYIGGLGIEAVAWSNPIGWGICGLFCVFYFMRGMWRGKMEIKTETPAEAQE